MANDGQGTPSQYWTGRPLDHLTSPSPRRSKKMRVGQEMFNQNTTWALPNAQVLERVRLVNYQREVLNRQIRRERKRKEKIPLPNCPRKGRRKENKKINLGKSFSTGRKLNQSLAHYTLYNFKQRLKKKDDNSFAMLCRLSTILVGVSIKTHFYYQCTGLYCSSAPGWLRIDKKPNLRATCSLVEQILHCRTNANQNLIARIINSF